MKKVPNLTPQGVSSDYVTAFGPLDNYIRRVENDEGARWVKLARNTFLDRKIRRYEEVFDVRDYEDVINSRNIEVVQELDDIVKTLNEMRDKSDTDYEKLCDVFKKIQRLIYG